MENVSKLCIAAVYISTHIICMFCMFNCITLFHGLDLIYLVYEI